MTVAAVIVLLTLWMIAELVLIQVRDRVAEDPEAADIWLKTFGRR